jgi:Protein phosphatase inhibitor
MNNVNSQEDTIPGAAYHHNQQQQRMSSSFVIIGGDVPAAAAATVSGNVPMATSLSYASAVATTTATMTMTEAPVASDESLEPEVLRLTLSSTRPSVHWDENVLDNEGLGRKSSKRCCIFHRQRSFGESSTDSSDYDTDGSGSSAASSSGGGSGNEKKMKAGPGTTTKKKKKGSGGGRKIARPKKPDNSSVPDYQRFHA